MPLNLWVQNPRSREYCIIYRISKWLYKRRNGQESADITITRIYSASGLLRNVWGDSAAIQHLRMLPKAEQPLRKVWRTLVLEMVHKCSQHLSGIVMISVDPRLHAMTSQSSVSAWWYILYCIPACITQSLPHKSIIHRHFTDCAFASVRVGWLFTQPTWLSNLLDPASLTLYCTHLLGWHEMLNIALGVSQVWHSEKDHSFLVDSHHGQQLLRLVLGNAGNMWKWMGIS